MYLPARFYISSVSTEGQILSLFPKPLGCIESAFTVLKDNQRVKIKVCTSFCSLGPTFNLHKTSFVGELMFFTSSHCPVAPVGQQRRQLTALTKNKQYCRLFITPVFTFKDNYRKVFPLLVIAVRTFFA